MSGHCPTSLYSQLFSIITVTVIEFHRHHICRPLLVLCWHLDTQFEFCWCCTLSLWVSRHHIPSVANSVPTAWSKSSLWVYQCWILMPSSVSQWCVKTWLQTVLFSLYMWVCSKRLWCCSMPPSANCYHIALLQASLGSQPSSLSLKTALFTRSYSD